MADSVVAGLVGVVTVYVLSITGQDRAKLKGALTGQTVWTALYGVLGTMGATKVYPVSPGTVLSEFAAHSAYGAVTTFLATKLGDPGLFNGELPISASKFHTAVNINIEKKYPKPSPEYAESKFEKHQLTRHTAHSNHYRRSEHRGLH